MKSYASDQEKESMYPHQLRVVEERDHLAEKLKALEAFIEAGGVFKMLPYDEQGRLKIQRFIMQQYRAVLEDRIDNFEVQPHA